VKRYFTRTGLLFMVLVVALASLGIAFGLWSKTLYINGTVSTGSLHAELSVDAVTEYETKDVGNCSATLGQTIQPNDTLNIEITDAYPSYECDVRFDVHNTGSIPIHVNQPSLSNANPGAVDVSLVDCYAENVQLHTSEMAYCTINIHVLQAAGMDADYTFSATVLVHQFNEPG